MDPEPIYVRNNNVYTSDGVSAGMGPDCLYSALRSAIADSNATVHVIGKVKASFRDIKGLILTPRYDNRGTGFSILRKRE
jgi:hypothetical protein